MWQMVVKVISETREKGNIRRWGGETREITTMVMEEGEIRERKEKQRRRRCQAYLQRVVMAKDVGDVEG